MLPNPKPQVFVGKLDGKGATFRRDPRLPLALAEGPKRVRTLEVEHVPLDCDIQLGVLHLERLARHGDHAVHEWGVDKPAQDTIADQARCAEEKNLHDDFRSGRWSPASRLDAQFGRNSGQFSVVRDALEIVARGIRRLERGHFIVGQFDLQRGNCVI